MRSSRSALILRPAVQMLKQRAELALDKKVGDVVLFNNQSLPETLGMTDVSFENHKAKKRVSMYFTSKPEGIASYRRCASMVAHLDNVELQYTPQFGQSRISFEWDSFWTMMDQNKLSFLPSESNPVAQIEQSHVVDIDMYPVTDHGDSEENK
ncbi:hypothetical protein AC1031_021538 [Aphanomyces cochlioides]|nr:hypothetical protein AC1031_021538 [Aphanomyces cochlioides]